MVTPKTWEEFQKSGLLWWINRILHTFGWAIVLVQETDGRISDAYPARVKWRGFSVGDEEKGFAKVGRYLKHNARDLYEEVETK